MGLLVIFMMINFADKAVVGLAAVPIIRDFHLTNEQFSQIGSAFFLLFSVSAALVGFVVNRVDTKIVLAAMAFIWALTLMPMLGLVSVWALVASHIVLGVSEGPAYPVALHAVYKSFPDERRAFPTSLLSIGAAIGVGLATPLLTWIILTYNWRIAFGFLGVVGFVWVAVWKAVGGRAARCPPGRGGRRGPAARALFSAPDVADLHRRDALELFGLLGAGGGGHLAPVLPHEAADIRHHHR